MLNKLRALWFWLLRGHCFCCQSDKPICHNFEIGRVHRDGTPEDSCPYCDHSAYCHQGTQP